MNTIPTLDVQGHRGCRGLWPENSIKGFLHALDLGVHTLELDIVFTKDLAVLVSHEPYFSSTICTYKDGTLIKKKEEQELKTYSYTLNEIKSLFICGNLRHPQFPNQQKHEHVKPSLEEVFTDVILYCKKQHKALPFFNIEIKNVKKNQHLYQPEKVKMVELVMNVITSFEYEEKTTIQCFDPEIMNILHNQYPKQRNAFLVKNLLGYRYNLKRLDFKPTIYSPYYKRINMHMLNQLQSKNIKVIPWTINNEKDMKRFIEMGVDGIITDYPNRLLFLVNGKK